MDPGDVDADPDEVRAARRARDGELIGRLRAGDEGAFGQLYDEWFDRVYDVAHRIVRDPDVAAEVAQDAFLSAWRNVANLEDPASFGGWLLRIARNGALNRQQKERRSSAIDDQAFAVIESTGGGASNAPAGFIVEDRLGRAATPGAALEDGEIVDLVWEAAEALPERDLEALDLQLRHGLSPAEIGEVLGMNRNAVNQLMHRLRGRLEVAIRARVVWRGGTPSCAVLRERLQQSGIVAFGAEAVRVIERHVPSCVTCDERQRLRLQPAALFASVPIMVAPVLLKQQAAAALTAAGVPMSGSVASGAVAGAGGASGTSSGVDQTLGHAGPSGEPPVGPDPSAVTQLHAVADAGGPPTAVTAAAARVAGDASRRRLLVGGAAAATVVVVLALVLAVGRRDGATTDLVTAAGTQPPTTAATTVAPSTTGVPKTTGGAPTTAAPVTAAPTTPPTEAPTTAAPPTTAPAPTTTTTTFTATATFTLTPPTAATGWIRPQQTAATSPTLSWTVASSSKVTIKVSGPEINKTMSTLSTEAQGSLVVCPSRTDTSGSREFCDLANAKGDTFTLTATAPDGTVLVSKSVMLTR